MDAPQVTEEEILEHTSKGSFVRGEMYFHKGAVKDILLHEREMEAHVQGSEPLPYTAKIQHDGSRIEKVSCTCPYHEGDWCKHIVAALLAHLRGGAEEEKVLAAMLEGMDRKELVAMIRRLSQRDHGVREWIQREYGV